MKTILTTACIGMLVVSSQMANAIIKLRPHNVKKEPNFSNVSNTINQTMRNFYINGNSGFGYVDISNDSGIDRSGFAWSANLGYQINPTLAAEVGYMNFPTIQYSGWGESYTLKTGAVVVSAKGSLPINNKVSLFAKAGMAYMKQSLGFETYRGSGTINSRDGIWSSIFSLGSDFHINNKVDFNLQGVFTPQKNNEMPRTGTALAGLTYKFS